MTIDEYLRVDLIVSAHIRLPAGHRLWSIRLSRQNQVRYAITIEIDERVRVWHGDQVRSVRRLAIGVVRNDEILEEIGGSVGVRSGP